MNTTAINPDASAFVLFPLGAKRFALPADRVAELAVPGSVHTVPMTTPLISGLLIRRGRIVPVCDAAAVLVGSRAGSKGLYLIAKRLFEDAAEEWTAIEVSGDCELCTAPLLPPTTRLPDYVIGLLSLKDEIVEVLDVDRLARSEARK
jgi:chemotaxis signal transduction protein